METATLSKEWKIYPFIVNGIAFHSRVDVHSTMAEKIARVGEEQFIEMNKECVKSLIKGEWTRENLEKEIERINANGSRAFIELA
jgi:hypothetical protein